MPYVFTNTSDFVEIVGLFVLLHQAVIEIWKLTGPKTRRYWEALAYIVYGPSLGLRRKRWFQQLIAPFRDLMSPFPVTVAPALRGSRGQRKTVQERLIKSFLLRGVGDSPVTEVSDADVKNILEIARLVEDKDVRRVSQLLDLLIRAGSQNAGEVKSAFRLIETNKADLREMLDRWIKEIGQEQKVSTTLLMFWRDEFNEGFLPGAIRAERELSNALKAAEYDYLRLLSRVSAIVAAGEAVIIGFIVPGASQPLDVALVAALAFAALILLPQGTHSLLKAIVGLGKRLSA